MTDKGTAGSPGPPVGQRSRRHSPWPLVIVIALPVLSFVLRLPLWVTLVLLVVGTLLLLFSPHLAERKHSDPKKAWAQLMAAYVKLQSAYATLRTSPGDGAARERFSKLETECLSLLDSRPESDWGRESQYVAKVRSGIATMSASIPDPGAPPTPSKEIGRLEELKKQGVISDGEFQAFSERFKVMVPGKASGVLETIAGLHLQCTEGEITKMDYHTALWSLLDKVDRGESGAAQGSATPV